MVMAAPGTTAPDESLTTPKIVPVGSCADTDIVMRNKNAPASRMDTQQLPILRTACLRTVIGLPLFYPSCRASAYPSPRIPLFPGQILQIFLHCPLPARIPSGFCPACSTFRVAPFNWPSARQLNTGPFPQVCSQTLKPQELAILSRLFRH